MLKVFHTACFFHFSGILYSSLVIGCGKSIKELASQQFTLHSKIDRRKKKKKKELNAQTRGKFICEESMSRFRFAELINSLVLYKDVSEEGECSVSAVSGSVCEWREREHR